MQGTTSPEKLSSKTEPRVFFAILVVSLIICATIGTATALFVYVQITPRQPRQHTYQVVDTVVNVQAGKFEDYSVQVPAGNTKLVLFGSFSTTPAGSSMEVLVMNLANFDNWRNSNPAGKYYDSGTVATGTFSVTLPDGDDTYYVVYANYSSFAVQVQTAVLLYYAS